MKLPPIRKSYRGRTVLDLPALTVADGSICAVVGANGSGKSTLGLIAAGLLSPDGRTAAPAAPDAGYMPQKSYAFSMPVLRNLRLTGAGEAEALALLERFGLSHLARQNAKKLSGGETARMALARLLLRPHGLLILDEPTASMDAAAALQAEELLLDYRARVGCTVLLITHSLPQARRLADTALFLKDGRLVEQGPAEQVLRNPHEAETRAFLEFYTA